MKKNRISLFGVGLLLTLLAGCATNQETQPTPFAQMNDILNQQIDILQSQYLEVDNQYKTGNADQKAVYRARLQLDDVRLELWSLKNGNPARARLIQAILHRNIAQVELKAAEHDYQTGVVSQEMVNRAKMTLLQVKKQLLTAPAAIKKANDFPALEKALEAYPNMSEAQLIDVLQGKYGK